MKQANHNTVDLLLRSLAKRERDESTAGEKADLREEGTESPLASDHLDADELNLYAEGVLPAPARARYAEHLADCGRCRRIIVGLAQAAGTIAQHETASQLSKTSFWQSLAALLSLPVLRYALPALVLTGLVAVGLLALREQERPDLVARNQQSGFATPLESAAPLNDPRLSDSPASASSASSPATVLQKQTEPLAEPGSSELKDSPAEKRGLLAETPDTNTGAKPTTVTAAKDARESSQLAAAPSSQPVFAPEPAPPKAAPLGEADTKATVRKEESVEREAKKRSQDEYQLYSKDDSPTHGPARSRSTSAGSRRDADPAAESRVSSGKDKNEAGEEIETRTVSGRRFRRQGNAWIDTAYEASRGATSVARGSEQFRALLADEPGLRAIVQQLGGEVVVVWKSRAYRIR